MKNKSLALILVLSLLLFSVSTAAAQEEPELTMTISKDFGYLSGFGSSPRKMQGALSMRIKGPDDLAQVVFYIDGERVGEDTEAPFRLQFNTDVFPLGMHSMQAVGFTHDGRELRSNVLQGEFVSAETGWKNALQIIGGMVGLMIAAMLIAGVITGIAGRRRKGLPAGAQRSYGPLGGTICPKCKRPFGVHVWGPNVVIGKLDRCPYCGKWSIVRRYSITELRQAEEAELAAERPQQVEPELSEEEKLRKALQESKFDDV